VKEGAPITTLAVASGVELAFLGLGIVEVGAFSRTSDAILVIWAFILPPLALPLTAATATLAFLPPLAASDSTIAGDHVFVFSLFRRSEAPWLCTCLVTSLLPAGAPFPQRFLVSLEELITRVSDGSLPNVFLMGGTVHIERNVFIAAEGDLKEFGRHQCGTPTVDVNQVVGASGEGLAPLVIVEMSERCWRRLLFEIENESTLLTWCEAAGKWRLQMPARRRVAPACAGLVVLLLDAGHRVIQGEILGGGLLVVQSLCIGDKNRRGLFHFAKVSGSTVVADLTHVALKAGCEPSARPVAFPKIVDEDCGFCVFLLFSECEVAKTPAEAGAYQGDPPTLH